MKDKQILATASEMSNLVNCYAFYVRDRKLIASAFIYGKADNKYFILQYISGYDGNPNICKLKTLEELKDWIFIPTRELTDFILDDYYKREDWRYNEPILNK